MHSSQSNQNQKLALQNIKVVDLSRLLPGPWCTQMLGDLGADIIKIEAPTTGDPSRHNPPLLTDSSVYFNSVNRNKRSIVIDLRNAKGLEVALRLLETADVVIESFSVGVAAKLGIDYETVKKINPNVIYCSITGFGQTGPLALSPGHDLVIQASAGMLGVTERTLEDNCQVPSFQSADYAAGAVACIGILAALRRRDHDGHGCYIDLGMFDSLMSMSNIVMTGALGRASGATGMPMAQVWGRSPRYTVYPTGDHKWIAVSLLEPKLWRRFCEAIGQPSLAAQQEQPSERLSDHGERGKQYRAAVAAYCMAHSRDEISQKMEALDIPVCPVLTPDEALNSPHTAAREMLEHAEHPVQGTIAQIGNPLKHSGLVDTKQRPAPTLGGNTQDILSELGYSAEQLSALSKLGAIA